MQTIADKSTLQLQLARWRDAGERVALVPTMGNLHAGHLSLVDYARPLAERIVVSVFVNPTQFGEHEDFDIYPRTLAADSAQLAAANVDLLFTPDVATMYPFGIDNATRVIVPELGNDLCGAHRPGHFDGVSTVVARLFAMLRPDVAVFGQKDFQQLMLIRRMVDDLGMPIAVHAAPTVRAADGLAMSSRNGYLDDAERLQATALYAELQNTAAALHGGERDFDALAAAASARLATTVSAVEYFAIRQAADLQLPGPDCTEFVVLVAARVGDVRLIDNLLVELA